MQTHRLKIEITAAKTRAQFSATLWRASAVALELGLFDAGVSVTLADYSSITLRVRKARLAADVLLEKTLAFSSLSTCTAAQWAAGTHEHARITLTSAEMNLAMASKLETLHVTVSAVLADGGSTEVLGMGELILHDANAVPGTVADNADPATSLAECDARFLRYDGAQTLTTGQKNQAIANIGIIKTADRITFPDGSFIYLNVLDS
jgi:hypothetical protein